MLVNEEGLNNGITLSLSILQPDYCRYGLSMTGIDSQGYSFSSNRSIMLDRYGQINAFLPRVQNTFFLILDLNVNSPVQQVRNNALFFFPNIGAD